MAMTPMQDQGGDAMSEMMQMMDQMMQMCEAMKAKMQSMHGGADQQVAAGYARAKGGQPAGMGGM